MREEPGVWVEGPDGELVPDYESTFPEINEGEVVHGTVVRVDKDEVLVDIGYKSEGVISMGEFSDSTEFDVGDMIEVLLESVDEAGGGIVLSKRKADRIRGWERIIQSHKEGDTVRGRVAPSPVIVCKAAGRSEATGPQG